MKMITPPVNNENKKVLYCPADRLTRCKDLRPRERSNVQGPYALTRPSLCRHASQPRCWPIR